MPIRSCVIFLLILLISTHFSRVFIYAHFRANQGFITQSYCENKARPSMHCNGRCYLKKKLAQDAEKEKKQQKNISFEILPVSFLLLFFSKCTILKTVTRYTPMSAQEYTYKLFHPPPITQIHIC